MRTAFNQLEHRMGSNERRASTYNNTHDSIGSSKSPAVREGSAIERVLRAVNGDAAGFARTTRGAGGVYLLVRYACART